MIGTVTGFELMIVTDEVTGQVVVVILEAQLSKWFRCKVQRQYTYVVTLVVYVVTGTVTGVVTGHVVLRSVSIITAMS